MTTRGESNEQTAEGGPVQPRNKYIELCVCGQTEEENGGEIKGSRSVAFVPDWRRCWLSDELAVVLATATVSADDVVLCDP